MNIDFNNPSHFALLCVCVLVYAAFNSIGMWCRENPSNSEWRDTWLFFWTIHFFIVGVALLVALGLLIYQTL